MKIISGGQTGADRGALDAALHAGVEVGGWCPAGRLAEDGRIPARYPLREVDGGYAERTEQNVRDSDATLIIGFGELRGGTLATRDFCERWGKPHLVIDVDNSEPKRVLAFLKKHRVRVLNVAGPRASERPSAYERAYAIVRDLLGRVSGQRDAAE